MKPVVDSETVLLRLYRQFGKEEAVKYLNEEISRLRFRIGELESEVAELKHEKNVVKSSDKNEVTKTVKQWKKDEFFIELTKQMSNQQANNTKCKKDLEIWRNKYFSLLAVCDKDIVTEKL